MQKVNREDIKVGMVLICGNNTYGPGSCWKKNGKVVPFRVVEYKDDVVQRETLDGKEPDTSVSGCSCGDIDNLYLFEHDLDHLLPGNVLEYSDGDTRIVQGTIGEIVFCVTNDKDRSAYFRSIQELKKHGWKLKLPPTEAVSEMTVAEISKALGKTVKVVE